MADVYKLKGDLKIKININTDDKTLKVEGVISDEDSTKIYNIIKRFELDNIELLVDTSNVTDMDCMFYNCNNLTSLDLNNFSTSNVTNMDWMFGGCSKLESLNVSNFDTSNVIDMSNMFSYCSELISLDISNFNFNNVRYYKGMFYGVPGTCEIIVKSEKEKQWLFKHKEDLKLESKNIAIKGE